MLPKKRREALLAEGSDSSSNQLYLFLVEVDADHVELGSETGSCGESHVSKSNHDYNRINLGFDRVSFLGLVFLGDAGGLR